MNGTDYHNFLSHYTGMDRVKDFSRTRDIVFINLVIGSVGTIGRRVNH